GGPQSVWMRAVQHLAHLSPGEPAAILKLGGVRVDLVADGLCNAANHQREGERPGLACDVAYRTNTDARLFERFPADGRLNRLARLDEAGKAGVHAWGKARAAAQKAAVVLHGKHDRDRIGAREVLCSAALADTPVTAGTHLVLAATASAEAVRVVPGEQGCPLGECTNDLRC